MLCIWPGQKVLIADLFARVVNSGYDTIALLSSLDALLVIFSYTIQIYFDFSGYCDMATGIGLMFNIKLPMNFNSPYKAVDLLDFWKRWHITLTRFFSRYVYIPLGGNRRGTIRTYLNIFIVFLVSGLWHGANWTFVLWGAMHGVFSLLTRLFHRQVSRLHPAFSWLVTFGFVNISWIYFRAESITQANQLIQKLLSFRFGSFHDSICRVFKLPEFRVFYEILHYDLLDNGILYLILFSAFTLFAVLHMKNTNERVKAYQPTVLISCVSIVFLIWSIMSFSGVSTFLYFNF